MIHVTSTDIETIWTHAKNIRADFVRQYYTSNTPWIKIEDSERIYRDMFDLLSFEGFDDSQKIVNSTQIFNDIPEETMKNGTLVWYFWLRQEP